MTVDDARKALEFRKNHIRCDELRAILHSLGFDVRDGKRAGHKVFVHSGLQEFHGASYNCGHGRNPEIKPPCIRDVIRLLTRFEAELIEWQRGK